jgi:hypothetical protein
MDNKPSAKASAKAPKTFIGLQFFDLDSENPFQGSCLITSRAMCKTDMEKSMWDSCVQFQEVIAMGKMVAKPVFQ